MEAQGLEKLFPQDQWSNDTSYLETIPVVIEEAYACETPDIQEIRSAAIQSLRKSSKSHLQALTKHATMSTLLKQYPQMSLDLINALTESTQQRPLNGLMKHEAMWKFIKKHPHIGIELIHSLTLTNGW